jgi:hypothetical protein
MDWAYRDDTPEPTAELAVFVDEATGWTINPSYFQVIWDSHNRQRYPLNLSGIPYDVYFLDDISNPALPTYKAYLFITSFTLTRDQAEGILAKRQPGIVLVFMGTPGLGSDDFQDPVALIKHLTGINCRLLPPGTAFASVPDKQCQNSIIQGLTGAFSGTGTSVMPVLSPDDPEAIIFGRFAETGLPSHAIKQAAGSSSIIIPQGQRFGGLTPQLLANIARLAGIRTVGTPGQCTYIGSGVAACHRIQPGPAAVTFEKPVDLIALDGKTLLASDVKRWEPQCDLLDTDIVFYQDHVSVEK